MADVNIRTSNEDDAIIIGRNLREADRKEIWLSHRADGVSSLRRGLWLSDICLTAELDNEPCVMFGVAPGSTILNTGIAWLLATDKAEKIKKSFVKNSIILMPELMRAYSMVENYVHVENKMSLRWLQTLGFKKGPSIYRSGEEFVNVHKVRSFDV